MDVDLPGDRPPPVGLASFPRAIERPELSDYYPRKRRYLLAVALALSPAVPFLGCGGTPDGSQVQVGDATKAEVKTRAALYRERNLQKQQGGSPR